ncbi:MAG: type II secretion system major pseudopilin GspG [Opitutaceae bacterium]
MMLSTYLRPAFGRQAHFSRPASFALRPATKRAFTLLEIMIALAILALLVGLAVTNLDTIFGNAQGTTAKLFVSESIKLPLSSYRIAMGDYPTTGEGLQALITAPATRAEAWHGPYFSDSKIPLDPWGEPYVYRYPGVHNKTGYDIYSKGPDKQDGTADDIGNW